MRVLGVARVSTQEQAQGDRFSIPHQREQITQYCLKRSWDLMDVVEYVHSGGSNYRELQQILEQVRHNHIQVVVVNELDRLARDMVTTLLFLEDLQKSGCRFASVADDMDLTTPDGELKMMILSVFAHYFRKQLARKVKGGLAERARQGKHHGGRPPYGFVFDKDRLAPHPEQALVVQQIYHWYVHEGLGGRAIAQRLMQAGVPTQTGRGTWATPEILRLIRRPANVGDLQHGELEFYTERTGVTHKRHREDALIVPNAHPAIVDRDTWNAAQQLLNERGQRSGRQGDSPYLLSGLVYCGLCGRTMVPVKGRNRRRYVCRGYQMSGLCSATHAQPIDVVEQLVVQEWLRRVSAPTPDMVRAWVQQMQNRSRQQSDRSREISQLQRRLTDFPSMRQRAEDALLSGVFDIAQYKAAIDRLNSEQVRLEQALVTAQDQTALIPSEVEADQLMHELSAAAEQFQTAGSVHQRRELLRRYITRIEMWPEEIKIFSGSTIPETSQ